MTREAAKKHIEVIKAFAEGKAIQGEDSDGEWIDCHEPSFSEFREYRIKHEQRYEPWTVFNFPLKCGDVILYKNNNNIQEMITGTDFSEEEETESVRVNGSWLSLNEIFEDYVMLDGTPCGEKVEE